MRDARSHRRRATTTSRHRSRPPSERTLAAACRGGDYPTASGLVAYRLRGDPARRWKDAYRVDHPEEHQAVVAVCDRINGSGVAEAVVIDRIEKEAESEGVWHILFVTSGDRELAFAFLPFGDSFILGDID